MDTSALYAFLDRDTAEHAAAVATLRDLLGAARLRTEFAMGLESTGVAAVNR